jgi:hypothetical protein
VGFVERFRFDAQQVGQFFDAFFAAGRALVDLGFALGDRLGIGSATGKAALAALRLRQDGIDFFRQRIALKRMADQPSASPITTAMPTITRIAVSIT